MTPEAKLADLEARAVRLWSQLQSRAESQVEPEPVPDAPEPEPVRSESEIPAPIAERMELWDESAYNSMQQCIAEGVKKPSELGYTNRLRPRGRGW